MKTLQLTIFLFLASNICLLAQKDLKRIQYDEFIYGITVPHLKSIKEIAAYYQIDENDIYEFNQQLNYPYLKYEEGNIVFLPAGTLLHNKNIAYIQLKQIYRGLPHHSEFPFTYRSPYSEDFSDSTYSTIKDTLVAKLLMTVPDDVDCKFHCTHAIASIDLKNNYKGYFISVDNSPSREDYLYIFYHNDFITRIEIAGISAGESGHSAMSATFDDFDKNGTIDILIKIENETYGMPPNVPKVNHSERYFPYKTQRITYYYSFFTLKNGMYINAKFPFGE